MSTIVIDPLGTPEAVFLRPGIALIDMVAAHAPNPGPTPAPIPLIADHMIVRISSPVEGVNRVSLPEDAQIGVLIETYNVASGGTTIEILPASGDTIVEGNISTARNNWFRKVTATGWYRIG